MKRTWGKSAGRFALLTAAPLIYGAGISLFLDPNHLAPGGMTGISVILSYLTGVGTGTILFLLNLPILILGAWKFGLRFILKTAYVVTLTSFVTDMLADRGAVTEDPLLAGLAGGVLIACGIGMAFRAGATTGGMDIIIKILRRRYRHLKTGFLFLCSDLVIASLSGLIFRNLNVALYALITVVVSGRTLNFVLYGGDEARMFYIITERPREIGDRLLKNLEAGVTYLQGKGGFTGREKEIVFCAVHGPQGPQVEEIVKEEDPSAFMIVTSASEIYGEGYKDLFADVL